MSIVVCQLRSPRALAASVCPVATAAIPPRTFSAMYAELKRVMVIIARYSSSMETFSGKLRGSRCRDMNRRVMSGTPRMISMNPTQKYFRNGSLLRRPSARAIPMGMEHTIPMTASSRFRVSPPRSCVGTGSSPGMYDDPITRIAETTKNTVDIMRKFGRFRWSVLLRVRNRWRRLRS